MKILVNQWISCAIVLFLLNSHSEAQIHEYLFMSHTYDSARPYENKIDMYAEQLNFDNYRGIWLGGDITEDPFWKPTTTQYLNSFFDLKDKHTHYVLGNHDSRNLNLDWYFQTTGRSDFYSSWHENLLITILNTNLNRTDCQRLDRQFGMLLQAIKDAEAASHYVLMMHHQIFTNDKRCPGFTSHGDLKNYKLNCAGSNPDFWTTIYPLLVALEEKGIEVIVLVGDTGFKASSEATSQEGVHFISNGLGNSLKRLDTTIDSSLLNPDQVIIFRQDVTKRTLTWEFVVIDD